MPSITQENFNENSDENNRVILYSTPKGKRKIALTIRGGNVWASQREIAEIFFTSIPNVNTHISNILKERELDEKSVIKESLITAADGKTYNVKYYSLEMILAVGFRVRGIRGTQFRQWANENLREYLVKGFVMDDERLKNPDGKPDYFDELLARIRDVRASEKRFYQRLRDLFKLSSDYDATDKATQMFFAETQNKLLYAVTGQTSAEIVVSRANAASPNMALTSWEGTRVRKGDIYIAKNYLTNDEIDDLNRLVNIFLETAELRVKTRRDLTTKYWRENVDRLLEFNDKPVLRGLGSVGKIEKERIVSKIYVEFDARRKREEARLEDERDLKELEAFENEIKAQRKNRKKP